MSSSSSSSSLSSLLNQQPDDEEDPSPAGSAPILRAEDQVQRHDGVRESANNATTTTTTMIGRATETMEFEDEIPRRRRRRRRWQRPGRRRTAQSPSRTDDDDDDNESDSDSANDEEDEEEDHVNREQYTVSATAVAIQSEQGHLETAAEYWKRKYQEEVARRRHLERQMEELKSRIHQLQKHNHQVVSDQNGHEGEEGNDEDLSSAGAGAAASSSGASRLAASADGHQQAVESPEHSPPIHYRNGSDSLLMVDPTFLDTPTEWKPSQHLVEGFVLAGVPSHLACAELLRLHISAQEDTDAASQSSFSDLPVEGTNSMFLRPQWIPPEILPDLQPQILHTIGDYLSSTGVAGALDWFFPSPKPVCTRTISWPSKKSAIQDCSSRSVALLQDKMLQSLEQPQMHYFTFGCHTEKDLEHGSAVLPSSTRYFVCLLFPQPICLDWRRLTNHLERAAKSHGNGVSYSAELFSIVRELLSPSSTTHYAISWRCLSVVSRYPFFGLLERLLVAAYKKFLYPQIEEEFENVARVALRSLSLTSHGTYQCYSPVANTGELPATNVAPLKGILKEGFSVQNGHIPEGTSGGNNKSRKSMFTRLRRLKPWRKQGKTGLNGTKPNGAESLDVSDTFGSDNSSEDDSIVLQAVSVTELRTELFRVWYELQQQEESVLSISDLREWAQKKTFTLFPPSPSCTICVDMSSSKLNTEASDYISWTRPGDSRTYEERLLEIPVASRYPEVRDLCLRLAQDHNSVSDDVGLPLGSEEANELIQEHALSHVLEIVPVHTLVALIGSLLVGDKVILTAKNLLSGSSSVRGFTRQLKQHNSFRPRLQSEINDYKLPRSWMQEHYSLSLTVLFLRSLLSPLQWLHPTLPIVPVSQISFVASPVPILAGVDYTDEHDMAGEQGVIYSMYDGSLYRPGASDGGNSPPLQEERLGAQLPKSSVLHHELSPIVSLLKQSSHRSDTEATSFRSHDFCLCIKERIFSLLVEIWEVHHDDRFSTCTTLEGKFRQKLMQEFRHSEIPFWNRFLATHMVEQFSWLMSSNSASTES